CPPPPLYQANQGGDGRLRGKANLSRAAERHPELRPDQGRWQRADALRRDDAFHRLLLQPSAHPDTFGRPAGDVDLRGAAREAAVITEIRTACGIPFAK